jgi:CHAT domain-containing protein
MGRRGVEPRLGQVKWEPCARRTSPDRVLPEIQCGKPAPPAKTECRTDRAAEAVRALVEHPRCTNQAVRALEEFAKTDPPRLNDLAAAYYVRAHRDDRPRDLLDAYKTVQEAASAMPEDAAVLFNRALIEESLGLPASWDAVPDDGTEWKEEARRRQARAGGNSAAQWRAVQAQLDSVRDVNVMARLISPFPGLAQKHLEASPEGRQTLAAALFQRMGDRFALDLVQGDPVARELLAQYQYAAAPAEGTQVAINLAALDRMRPVADQRQYRYLVARIDMARAYCISYQGRFVEALTLYESMVRPLATLGDQELLAGVLARRAGVSRVAGDLHGAARDLLRAIQYKPRLATGKELQNVFGAAGNVAEDSGHPALALRYQEMVVAFYRRLLQETSPANPGELTTLQGGLAIALYNRARIKLLLEETLLPSALKDLDDARALNSNGDVVIQRFIRMRIEEIRGQMLLSLNDRAGAVAAFTNALNLTADDKFQTYKASLYLQRAKAGSPDAEGDYRRAVEAIEKEEALILDGRRRGEGEEIWSVYFARFDEAYRSLIRYPLFKGDPAEAFRLMERARAREPRDLLMQVASRSLREAKTETLADIQNALPAGTWLLEFCVFDDATYVWRISRDEWKLTKLPVTHAQIKRWAEILREAAERNNATAFGQNLDTPHERLLQPVLPPGGPQTRLVIIPDGAMHALPFAGLHNRTTDRFLMEDYILESAPSAALYVSALARNRELQDAGPLSVLAIGNPDLRGMPHEELGNLPYAEEEAGAIGQLYERRSVLLGKAATEEAVLRLAPRHDIVHAAMHALVLPDAPAGSMLLLSSGPLTAKKLVANLKVDRTRLVILSACSSAGGRPVGPEGVAPLVRPILAANVPAIVGSLRTIFDNPTTKELFVSFHAEYRAGRDAAKALQAAQQRMLRHPSLGRHSALSWALFQVIGHNAPTHENDKGEPP